MRVRRKTLWGKISEDGDLMANWESLTDFCHFHKGRNVIVRVEVQSVEPSERMTNYFFGYVVKEVQRALYDNGENLTESQTYDYIRNLCPLFLEEKRENGIWKTRAKEWGELDSAEAVDVIAWIQRWASEELYIVIDDAEV